METTCGLRCKRPRHNQMYTAVTLLIENIAARERGERERGRGSGNRQGERERDRDMSLIEMFFIHIYTHLEWSCVYQHPDTLFTSFCCIFIYVILHFYIFFKDFTKRFYFFTDFFSFATKHKTSLYLMVSKAPPTLSILLRVLTASMHLFE